jgi:FtsP/CotA-like multicopper oxidase with cupredoxin domain
MSRNQRIGLIVAAALVAVLAFVIASPGGDDESENAAQTTPAAQTETGSETGKDSGTDTQANSPPETRAVVTRIDIRAGEVAGGPAEIRVKKGDTVAIVVAADAPDDIHLHGYDIEKKVAPGQPARFRFKSNLEGEFEIESHVAEDAGRDPLVGTLIVEPR